MGIGHRNDFLWDTDAASGFTYRNTGINLPKLFPSNCTAGQIQFSWYVRNEPSSAGAHVWGFCICNPEGCPNSSSDIPTSSHGSFGQLYHMKGSQLHNCLTCPITFLAALLPFSLDKLSPGARSQGGIAKILYFSKSLFLGETGSMRNVIAGLEEFFFFSAEICYHIFSFFPLYLLLWTAQVYKHISVRQWPFRHELVFSFDAEKVWCLCNAFVLLA